MSYTSKQPVYSKSETKYKARELPIAILYPLFTGNHKLPAEKQYLFLCNLQDKSEGSEVSQLIKKRPKGQFAKLNQICGVDKSKSLIKKNKRYWPEANWFDDEWTKVIQDNKFNPGIVYLDTTYMEDKYPALRALKHTLEICKKNTLLICNVMMSNPRAGSGQNLFDENVIIDNLLLSDHPDAYEKWNVSYEDPNVNIFHSYEYQTNKTPMRSYIFFKGTLPSEDTIINKFDEFKDWCKYNQFVL